MSSVGKKEPDFEFIDVGFPGSGTVSRPPIVVSKAKVPGGLRKNWHDALTKSPAASARLTPRTAFQTVTRSVSVFRSGASSRKSNESPAAQKQKAEKIASPVPKKKQKGATPAIEETAAAEEEDDQEEVIAESVTLNDSVQDESFPDDDEAEEDEDERKRKILRDKRARMRQLMEKQKHFEEELEKIKKEAEELPGDSLFSPAEKVTLKKKQQPKVLVLGKRIRGANKAKAKGRSTVYKVKRVNLPPVEISEQDKGRIIGKFLPPSWNHEIIECYTFEKNLKSVFVFIRANLNSVEDATQWIKDFVTTNKCKFILRRKEVGDRSTGKINYVSMLILAEYMCHKNKSRLEAMEQEKGAKLKGVSKEETRICPSFVRIDVLRDNETVLESDPYAQEGMRGRIVLRWDHSHELDSEDMPSEEFLDCFPNVSLSVEADSEGKRPRAAIYRTTKRSVRLPTLDVSEQQKEMIIGKFLPDGWTHEVAEVYKLEGDLSSVYALLRANIGSKEELLEWMKHFVTTTNCKFVLRRRESGDTESGKMNYISLLQVGEYMCHRNGNRSKAMQREKEGREKGLEKMDARICGSFVQIDLLRDTEVVLKSDEFSRKGLRAKILLRWDHSHPLEESDAPDQQFLSILTLPGEISKFVGRRRTGNVYVVGPDGKKIRRKSYLDAEGNPKSDRRNSKVVADQRDQEKGPPLELTEEMRDSIFEHFLPEGLPHVITKCWSFSDNMEFLDFEARTSIETEDDAKEWVGRVSEKTGAIFFRRSIIRETVVVDFNAEYVCHRSAPRHPNEKVQLQKSKDCPSSIRIFVKKHTDELMEKDYFAREQGWRAVVTVHWGHTHDLADSDLTPELIAAGRTHENPRAPTIKPVSHQTIELSTVDKERIIGRFMPEGFMYELSKCWQFNPQLTSFHVELRMNLETEEEAENWIEDFKAKTGARIRTRRKGAAFNESDPRTSKGMVMKAYYKDYICHRSSHQKNPIKRKGYPSKNKNCPMFISVAIMKDYEKTRKRDPYVVKGLRGRIRLFWEHTHDLRDSDLVYRKDLDDLSQRLLNSVNAKALRLYKKGLKSTNECDEERARIVQAAKTGQTPLLKQEIFSKTYSEKMIQKRKTKSLVATPMRTRSSVLRKTVAVRRPNVTIMSRSTPKRRVSPKKVDVSVGKPVHLSWDANTSSYVVSDDQFDIDDDMETEMATNSLDFKTEPEPDVEYQLDNNSQIWCGVFGVNSPNKVPRDILGNFCKILAHSIRTTWTSQTLTEVLHQTDIENDTAVLDASLPFIVTPE